MRYKGKIAVAAYLAFLAVFVFWILDKQVLYGNETADWAIVGLVVAVHVALGVLVGRRWALALPLLSVAMAAPLGYPSANKGEPFPIWVSLLFYVPFGIAFVAAGIGLRKLVERRTV